MMIMTIMTITLMMIMTIMTITLMMIMIVAWSETQSKTRQGLVHNENSEDQTITIMD